MEQPTNKSAAVKPGEDRFDENEVLVDPKGFARSVNLAPAIYANHLEMAFSPWDFMMRFFEFRYGGVEDPIIRELVGIVLSPPQAKAARDLLARQVALYENKYGEITDIAKVLTEAQQKA